MPGTRTRCIGFDADDTLWHNENIFEKVHARYCELLSRHHDAATVERELFKTEMRNLELYGYGIKGFTLSSIETAIRITDGKFSAQEIRELIGLGRSMLEHPVELLEGAKATLRRLSGDYRLILITKGDLRDQERKLAKSGLARRFDAIEIVSEKDAPTYRRILERLGIEPREFLMVGNSMKSDILPVLKLGGSGVHVPYRILWGHEHAKEPTRLKRGLFKLQSLSGLCDVVKTWNAGIPSKRGRRTSSIQPRSRRFSPCMEREV